MKTAEWLIIPRMQDIKTLDTQSRLKRIITTLVQKRGTGTLMMTWTTTNEAQERLIADEWKEWITDITSEAKPWTITTHTIRNEQVGGPIESRHTVLLATQAPRNEWKTEATPDGPKGLETAQDEPNSQYSDYFKWTTGSTKNNAPTLKDQ
jgi:hypothetical protein